MEHEQRVTLMIDSEADYTEHARRDRKIQDKIMGRLKIERYKKIKSENRIMTRLICDSLRKRSVKYIVLQHNTL